MPVRKPLHLYFTAGKFSHGFHKNINTLPSLIHSEIFNTQDNPEDIIHFSLHYCWAKWTFHFTTFKWILFALLLMLCFLNKKTLEESDIFSFSSNSTKSVVEAFCISFFTFSFMGFQKTEKLTLLVLRNVSSLTDTCWCASWCRVNNSS